MTTVRPIDYRLVLQSRTDREYDLTFELESLESGTVAAERTRTVGPSDVFDFDDAFSPGENYRFLVMRVGKELFDLKIYAYERYLLSIRPGPEVEVRTLIED